LLCYSRFRFARYVLHKDLLTLLHCQMQAFEALDGVPIEILYDRIKTAVTGENDQGYIVYNTSLPALAKHYRFQPRALPPLSRQNEGEGRAVGDSSSSSLRTNPSGESSLNVRPENQHHLIAKHQACSVDKGEHVSRRLDVAARQQARVAAR